MAIKLNGTEITINRLNGTSITEESINGTKVYPSEPQIYVEFDFLWNSQTNSYAEYGYPAPMSQGDNYNRVNLIGGPELEESKLNDLLFNVFGTGAKEKISGNFTNFNVWYEAIFPVESSVFAKAEVRFGPDYMDLRKGQFSENNMASWYDYGWDFNGVKLPEVVQTREWLFAGTTTSNPGVTPAIFGNVYSASEAISAMEALQPAENHSLYTFGSVYNQNTGIYWMLEVRPI